VRKCSDFVFDLSFVPTKFWYFETTHTIITMSVVTKSMLLRHTMRSSKSLKNSVQIIRYFSHDHDHDHDHGHDHNHAKAELVNINWILRDGSLFTTQAKVGSNLLRVAQRYELDIEGACEGVCACSTCHCILDMKTYESLPEPSEVEEDMLDQAFGLTATSRLGCQVEVTKALEGITVKLPKATRNFYVVSPLYYCAIAAFNSTSYFFPSPLSPCRMGTSQSRTKQSVV